MKTLRQYLFDCDLALLRAIALQWNIDLPTNRHDDAVDTLTAHLSDSSVQADHWSALPQAERDALAALVASGGTMPIGTFTRRFGDIRLMGPGRLEREQPWTSPTSIAESLWYRGLIVKAFDHGPGGMQEVVYAPQEFRTMIEATGDMHARTTITPMPAPAIVHQANAQLADDLCGLLAYIHATPVNIAPGHSLSEKHARIFGHQLRDSNSIRLDLLVHLALQLSLVKPDTDPLRLDPQTATAWLQSQTLQQQRSLFEAWRKCLGWNDLWHVPTLRCEDTGSWQNDPLAARKIVIDTLGKLQANAWYRVDDFVAIIRATLPDFQRPGGDYDIWYIRDAATNQYLKGFESWDQVEGALLRFLIRGMLHWLGVVDMDADGEAFCTTPVGCWLLGQSDVPSLHEGSTLVIRADGHIEVSASRRYDRFQLARIADWVASDETYMYRITPASLERAKTQRITPERIIEFLGRTRGTPMPESLAKALRRWGTRGTEAWVQQAVMLRVAQPELLDQLMDSPRTRKFIREAVSSTVALVAPHDWPELIDELFEMGLWVEASA